MTGTHATIVIPRWHPPRLNQWDGRHWAARARLKRQTRDMVAAYARQLGVPPATGKRRVGLAVWLRPRCRGGDPDAYHKALLDALVACRLLVDDARQWCEITPVRYERRRDWWGCEITLEDVPSDGLSVAPVPPPRRRGKRERRLFDGENGAN